MVITLDIDGMHCATCSSAIEKQLRKLSEVSEASVNLVTEKAYVTGKDDVSEEALITASKKAVKKAGYEAFETDDN